MSVVWETVASEGLTYRSHTRRNLQVGARAAVTAVAGFEDNKGCQKGKGEKFFPVLHAFNFVRLLNAP